MKTKILSMIALCAALGAYAANPFLPLWEYIPDGEPYVFDDPDSPGRRRVYVYGSHDVISSEYCGRDQVVWSADASDLDKWRFDGVIFRSVLDRDGNPLDKRMLGDILYAPDVAEVVSPDGKKTYYLYPNTQADGRRGMVAKSDRPDGPFTVCNWSESDAKTTEGPLNFDPAVLVDDDGRVYAYWGFWRSCAAELDPRTMATVKPGTEIIEDMVSGAKQDGDFRFFEASSIRKIKGMYVFIYSRWTKDGEFGLPSTNYTLAYAYSKKPLGPWTYGGTIIDGRARETSPDGKTRATAVPGGNTHGSICEINGRWWVFYHRQCGLDEFSRQAMVAPVDVRVEDGKVFISEGEYTSEGFEIGGLDPFERHAAGIASRYTGPRPAVRSYPKCRYSGPYTVPFRGDWYKKQDPYDPEANRCDLANCTDGSTVGYKYFDFSKTFGKDGLKLRLAMVRTGIAGRIEVYAGSVKVGEAGIAAEADDVASPFELEVDVAALKGVQGRQELRFVFASGAKGASVCTLRDFRFTASGGRM